MRRGDVLIGPPGGPYGSKPRPVVLIQDMAATNLDSIVVCPFTTTDTGTGDFRVPVAPSAENGLAAPCFVMIDKPTAMPLHKVAGRAGQLDPSTMSAIDDGLTLLLGLTRDAAQFDPPAAPR